MNRLGSDWLESTFAEEAAGLLVDTKWNVSWKFALVAKAASSSCPALELHQQVEVVILLLRHAESTSGVVCPGLGCPVKGRLGHAGARPMKGCKDVEEIVACDI